VVRLAALVHDVTHIPFGHNVEDQAGLMHRHDTAARYESMLGSGTALGRRLRALGVEGDVLSILTAEGAGAERAGIPPYWGQLVSDTICSDILDYLASGMTESEILSDFPDLSADDIRACLEFAADRERKLVSLPPE